MARPADAAAASPRAAQALQRAWLTRGPLAICLLPAAWLFAGLSALRRGLYRVGWLRSEKLPVPVVVVGNLIVGGAGKTPTVIAIAHLLRERGFTPGVISRGYARSTSDVLEVRPESDVRSSGDEPLLMRLRLQMPVVVGRDRVAAARELLRLHASTDVIVSDDGLQHWRLQRNVQVIVFDERGIGNGWRLPAGPLREPLPSALPPDTLVLYNADRPSTRLAGSMSQRALGGAVSLADWWQGRAAQLGALAALKGRRVIAAAGMAHPKRFFDMLVATGLTIEPLALPDHFDFATLPWPPSAQDIVVTEKDAIKLLPEQLGATKVWVVPLDFRLDDAFERALLDRLTLSPDTPTRTSHGHPTT